MLNLFATGNLMAFPQQPEQPEKAAEAKASGEMQQEQKPKVKTSRNDEDKDTSVTLPHSVTGLGERFLLDQKQIWTSPAHLRWQDANWLLPLGGVTAGMFVTDADMSRHLSRNPTTISHYNTISNATIAGVLGGAGAMWLLSYPKHDQHWRETGFLAGEAVVNSLVVVEAMKYPLGRQRPFQGNGNGDFFQGGVSFPSEHAAAAWAVAGVVAHEYPGPLTKIVAYSLATLVDYSRYRARQHFPSDVFIGSVVGNLVAEGVYNQHHDVELGGDSWIPFRKFLSQPPDRTSANAGSPYVPLDSWIYPTFDRLAAMGYVSSGIFGIRPWTRLECTRLLNEAGEKLDLTGFGDKEAVSLYNSLSREFSSDLAIAAGGDNRKLQVESVYARMTGISGMPLTDGFHFGQTISNDLGAPFAEGFNTIDGFSGWATNGRLVMYVRGEYQYAPSSPALPLTARQFIGTSVDSNGAVALPVPPGTPIPSVNHFQLLDTYVALNLENWQFSFGKQSLAWGSNESGPMMFSDNAVPITMFRIDRVSPFKLPWLLGLMGPMRWTSFLGRLSGHNFVYGTSTGLIGQWGQALSDQPFIFGQKLNFKPTPNFEFGVDYTRVTAGPGQPFTFHQFLQSVFSLGNGNPGTSSDPGDIRSGVDFQYKVPGLRNWLTFYGDAFTEDEFSPLGYPRKSAFEGGLYLPKIPGIAKLDFRVEGGSTSPVDFTDCVACFYDNGRFINSYTNQGNVMGSWIGRASQGERASSNYWLTSRDKIQVSFRHRQIDGLYAPGGGSVNDGEVSADIWLNQTMELSGFVQFEKWDIPVLAATPQSNVATSVQFTFWPRGWK